MSGMSEVSEVLVGQWRKFGQPVRVVSLYLEDGFVNIATSVRPSHAVQSVDVNSIACADLVTPREVLDDKLARLNAAQRARVMMSTDQELTIIRVDDAIVNSPPTAWLDAPQSKEHPEYIDHMLKTIDEALSKLVPSETTKPMCSVHPSFEEPCLSCAVDRASRVERKPSNVDHPNHYNVGKIEVIVAIEDWKLGFNLGNAIKYIARAAHKGRTLEDLQKAKWYLEREIQNTTPIAPGTAEKPKTPSQVGLYGIYTYDEKTCVLGYLHLFDISNGTIHQHLGAVAETHGYGHYRVVSKEDGSHQTFVVSCTHKGKPIVHLDPR